MSTPKAEVEAHRKMIQAALQLAVEVDMDDKYPETAPHRPRCLREYREAKAAYEKIKSAVTS